MKSYFKRGKFNPSKYKNIKQTYNGYSYDSKKEAQYAAQLDWMIEGKIVERWERQIKIPLDVNTVHIANYFIDFVVYFTDGHVEYHEVKGFETDVWKLKWRLSQAMYPDRTFILIK